MSNLPAPPSVNVVIPIQEAGQPTRWDFTKEVTNWLQNSLVPSVQNSSQVVKYVPLTVQAATIALTPLPLGSIPDGQYRVSVYARITTPASVSSSLQPTITWTDGGFTQTETIAAMTGNTTATQDGFVKAFHSDGGAPISYSAAYASVGTPMQYRLDITLERIG